MAASHAEFVSEWGQERNLRDIDLTGIWHLVHERLLQDAGAFSSWLRNADNHPGVWSKPIDSGLKAFIEREGL